jgi:hypothetical protein
MQIVANYRSQGPTAEALAKTLGQDALPNPAAPGAPATPAWGDVSGEVLRGGNVLSFVPDAPLGGNTAGVHGRRNTELADTSGSAETGKAVRTAKAADPTAAIVGKLAKLPPDKQIGFVHELRAKDPAKFDALVTAIRAGKVSDPKVVLPVSIELISGTAWGATADGKAVLAQVRDMYAKGKVTLGNVQDNNLGFTKPDKASDGLVGGKGTPSEIILNTRLAGAPEALAAVLAHEGLHAYQYAKALTPKSALDVEVGASLVGARVWAEMGGDKEKVAGKDAQAMVQQMKGDAASYDPKRSPAENQWRMELQVATVYSSEIARSGDRSRFNEGARMINQLLGRADAKDVLKAASDSDIKRLTYAYQTFLKAKSPYIAPAHVETLFNLMGARDLWKK